MMQSAMQVTRNIMTTEEDLFSFCRHDDCEAVNQAMLCYNAFLRIGEKR